MRLQRRPQKYQQAFFLTFSVLCNHKLINILANLSIISVKIQNSNLRSRRILYFRSTLKSHPLWVTLYSINKIKWYLLLLQFSGQYTRFTTVPSTYCFIWSIMWKLLSGLKHVSFGNFFPYFLKQKNTCSAEYCELHYI